MEENMKENIEEVKELEELMGRIAEAMQQSRNKQAEMDAKNYELHNETRPMMVDEGKVQLEDMRQDKAEFDEMTVNALKRAQAKMLALREKTEEEYNKRLETKVERINEIKRKLEGLKAHAKNPEMVNQAEESANRAIQNEEEAMSAYQARHEDIRGTLDNTESDLRNYAIELDVLREILSVTPERTNSNENQQPQNQQTENEIDENQVDENEQEENTQTENEQDEQEENTQTENEQNEQEENTQTENEQNKQEENTRNKNNNRNNKSWIETQRAQARRELKDLEQSVAYLKLSGIEDKDIIAQRDLAKKKVELLNNEEYASLLVELENIERMSVFYGGEIEEGLADRKAEIQERLMLLENDELRSLEEQLENVERWAVHYQDDPESAKPFEEEANEIRKKLEELIKSIKEQAKEGKQPIYEIFMQNRNKDKNKNNDNKDKEEVDPKKVNKDENEKDKKDKEEELDPEKIITGEDEKEEEKDEDELDPEKIITEEDEKDKKDKDDELDPEKIITDEDEKDKKDKDDDPKIIITDEDEKDKKKKDDELEPEPVPRPDPDRRDNLPVRSFWEIVDATETEFAGTIPTIFNRYSKIKPFKASMSFLFSPVKLAIKGLSWVGDKVCGAGAKKEILQKNIDALSQEEFNVLKRGMTQQEMRQSKMNEIYLEAIYTRLERENSEQILNAAAIGEQYEAQANEQLERRNQLQEELDSPRTPEERKNQLRAEIQMLEANYSANIGLKQAFRQSEEVLGKEIYDFRDGIDGKSNRRMNIKGWFAARFNPNNKKYVHEMGETSREMREACERGDQFEVARKREELDEIKQKNTRIIKPVENIGFLRRFASRIQINRGDATYEKHEVVPSNAPQTKGRELMGTIAGVAALVNLAERIYSQTHTQTNTTSVTQQDIDNALATRPEAAKAIHTADAQSRTNNVLIDHNTDLANNNGYVSGNDAAMHAQHTGLHQSLAGQDQAYNAAMAANDSKAALDAAVGAHKVSVASNAQQYANLDSALQSYTTGGVGAGFDWSSVTGNIGTAQNVQSIINFEGSLANIYDILENISNSGILNNTATTTTLTSIPASMLSSLALVGSGLSNIVVPDLTRNPEIDFNDQETVNKIEKEISDRQNESGEGR